jgi:hypothetical protein
MGRLNERIQELLLGLVSGGYVVGVVENTDFELLDYPRAQKLVTPDRRVARDVAIRCFGHCHLPRRQTVPDVMLPGEMGDERPRDLILEHQLRSLWERLPADESRLNLQRILRNLFGGVPWVRLERLALGRSGAPVFLAVCGSPGKEQKFAIKLTPALQWSKTRWVTHWEQIQHALNAGGLAKHVPTLFKPAKPGANLEFHANTKGWFAEAWQFLDPRLAPILDFQAAYQLQTLTDDDIEDMVNRLFQLLCHAWYENKQVTVRESRALWSNAERAYVDSFDFPPYQLTTRWKIQVLCSLEDLDKYGYGLVSATWADDVRTVRQWLIEGPSSHGRALVSRNVVLSPIHGDLNKNNILFLRWAGELKPFLIDFVAYRPHAHTLQDFAQFETEVKLALMETEQTAPSGALDLDPRQLPIWMNCDAQLAINTWMPEAAKANQSEPRSVCLTRALNIVQLTRNRALEVHTTASGNSALEEFQVEYAAALLYPTLRSIAYDSLSVLKRLLAVHSAARLIRFLEMPS